MPRAIRRRRCFTDPAEHKARGAPRSGPDRRPFTRLGRRSRRAYVFDGAGRDREAEPGDIIEVRILDTDSRRAAALHAGKCFGSIRRGPGVSLPRFDRDEAARGRHHLRARQLGGVRERPYIIVWTPAERSDGIVHPTIDYPGVRVGSCDHKKSGRNPTSVKVRAADFRTHGLRPSEVISSARSRRAYRRQYRRLADRQGRAECISVAYVQARFFSVGDPHAVARRQRNLAAPRSRPR